jgi:hypothetical protein
MNKKRGDELADVLIEAGVSLAITAMFLKLAQDLRKNSPELFWSYFKQKNETVILNCRM